MFLSVKAFIVAINCLALAVFKCDVSVLAFCFLNNHFHIIIYCAPEVMSSFKQSFRGSLTKNIHNLTNDSGRLGGEDAKVYEITHLEDLRDAIAYCHRNPKHHSLTPNFWGYRHNTIRLFFKIDAYESKPKDVVTDPLFIKRHLPRHRTLPEGCLMNNEGMILPQTFVAISMVEEIFHDRSTYNRYMETATKRETRGNKEEAMMRYVKYTDDEVFTMLQKHCIENHIKKPLGSFEPCEKMDAADYLYDNELYDSVAQISRILGIPVETLYSHFHRRKAYHNG